MRPHLLAALALAGACTKANPEYCDDQVHCGNGGACDPSTNTCGPGPDAAPPDARIDCTRDEDCTGVCDQSLHMCAPCSGAGSCGARTDGKNVCDGMGVCRACVTSDDCADLSAPVCGADFTCGPCAGDGECESRGGLVGEIGICTGAGACVGDSGTIFVDNSSPCTAPDGSASAPYCLIDDAVAVVSGSRNLILVRAGEYASTTITDKTLLLKGRPGARIDLGLPTKSRIDVSGGEVEVRGFALSGATTEPAAGLWCHSSAICTLSGADVGLNAYGVYGQNADVTVARTVIHENASGGLLTTASDFTVTNTMLWGNGGSTSIGGVQLGTNGAMSRRLFRNNTVFSNYKGGISGSVGAVQCQIATSLGSNIFWANETPMIGSACAVDHSVIDDATIGGQATNTTGDPLFMSTSPVAPNLHIQAGSSAIDGAAPTGAPLDDIDGEPRDAMPDIGADELVP